MKNMMGLLSFIVSAAVTFAIAENIYQESPYDEVEGSARVDTSKEINILYIDRKFSQNKRHSVVISSELVNGDSTQTIQLADTTYIGTSSFHRSVILPKIHGHWCLLSEMNYSYRLSITEHTEKLKPICFIIP